MWQEKPVTFREGVGAGVAGEASQGVTEVAGISGGFRSCCMILCHALGANCFFITIMTQKSDISVKS